MLNTSSLEQWKIKVFINLTCSLAATVSEAVWTVGTHLIDTISKQSLFSIIVFSRQIVSNGKFNSKEFAIENETDRTQNLCYIEEKT